jgi:signal transduction histidine kinase
VVHYASLAAGRYRFIVEAMTADGVVSEQPAIVSFTVLSPVWRRWWFVSLTALSFAAILYSVYRYRLARVIELERMRTRIAADLHDDIGGSLSRIAIQSEVVRREAGEPAGAPDRRLGEIAETARNVVAALGDVVWSVDPRQDSIGSVERRVREYAADVLGACGIRWTFQGSDHLDRLALNAQARRDLLLLLKEAVTNIAHHAGATSASLCLKLTGGELRAELRDDGCGFDESSLHPNPNCNGHGLANMRARAARLGGQLEINSVPGAGTALLLRVPLLRRRMNMRFP